MPNARNSKRPACSPFRRLTCELRAVYAPAALRRRAGRSMRDEARHTRTMRTFARRFGGVPRRVRIAPLASRDLVGMAIQNAVEGCVFETWAALLATWQAEHAADPHVRAAMQSIARGEARHAALAWDVAEWLEARLDPAEASRVREAKTDVLARLRAQIDVELGDDVREVAGLPSNANARAFYNAWVVGVIRLGAVALRGSLREHR